MVNCAVCRRELSYIDERLILKFYDDFILIVFIILSSLIYCVITVCPKKKESWKKLGIFNISHPGKKSLRNTKCRFSLQNSPSKSASVIWFGEAHYKKLKVEDYALKRSPIKMELIDHKKYNSLISNKQCSA